MRDFNKNVPVDSVDIGQTDKDLVNRELYGALFEKIPDVFYVGQHSRKIKVLDLFCSQSAVKDFLYKGDENKKKFIEYIGLDLKPFEKNGKLVNPEICCSPNSMPDVQDESIDVIFTIGQKAAYGAFHQSIFEYERVIRPWGFLVVSISKFWYLKQFNQLLFCSRNWQYVRAIEVKYKLSGEELLTANNEIDTSRFYLIYRERNKMSRQIPYSAVRAKNEKHRNG